MNAKEMRARILFLCQKINSSAYIRRGDIRYGNTYAVWTNGYGPITDYMSLASLHAYIDGVFGRENFMHRLNANSKP